jgi:hypothetical protein
LRKQRGIMKTLFMLLLVTFTSKVSGQTFKAGPTFKNAVEYNDYIVDLQNQISGLIIEFNEKIGEPGATRESIQPHFDKMLLTTEGVISKIEKIKGYEGNVELRNTATELFKFYYKTFSVDYKALLDVLFLENLGEEEIAKMTVILERVTADEAVVDANFSKAQQAFAKQHNIELKKNEFQDDLDGL